MTSDKIKIHKLEERGDAIKGRVYNWVVGQRKIQEIPIFYRTKGVSPEGHFHTGKDKSCDPQFVVLFKGRINFKLEYLNGEKQEITLNEGEMIEIPKFVFHSYEAEEEIIFAEPRETEYREPNDKGDYAAFKLLQEQYDK